MFVLILNLSLTIYLLATLVSPTPIPPASLTSSSVSPLDPPSPNTPQTLRLTQVSPLSHRPISFPPTPRSISPPPLRRAGLESDYVIWQVPHSSTHLNIRITTSSVATLLLPVLSDAYNSVFAHLLTNGDGLVAAGTWSFAQRNVGGSAYNVGVSLMNANNHQLTWGVLGAAIWGLGGFMRTRRMFGAAVFEVWDGTNQVGRGALSVWTGGGG